MLDDRTCTPLFVAKPSRRNTHAGCRSHLKLQTPGSPPHLQPSAPNLANYVSRRHTRRIASEAPNFVSVLPMWLRCGVYMTSDSGRMVSALVAYTISDMSLFGTAIVKAAARYRAIPTLLQPRAAECRQPCCMPDRASAIAPVSSARQGLKDALSLVRKLFLSFFPTTGRVGLSLRRRHGYS
jgi:hypothetical protein